MASCSFYLNSNLKERKTLNFSDFREALRRRRNRLRQRKQRNKIKQQYRKYKLRPQQEAGVDYSDSQDNYYYSGLTIEFSD